MSKFEGLEGIDLESKEVFETSDVEDDFDLNDEHTQRRDSILEEAIDPESSRKAFEKTMIDAHVTDFSDRIDRLESYETYSVKETVQNKLNRLRLELEELEGQIEEEGSKDSEELNKLVQIFSKLNQKTKERKLGHLAIDAESTKPSVIDTSSTSQLSIAQFEELEAKISQLERTVGSSSLQDVSIQSTINDIYRKFKLLSNDHESLISIIQTVDEVNSKLEKSIAVRRSVEVETIVQEQTQIHEIYTKIQSNKQFLSDLPFIIKRLESLNELHLRTSQAVTTIEETDSHINSLKEDFISWDKSLTSLEAQMQQLETNFNKNKEAILSKLK